MDYQTVKGRASARFVEKKSEFIGTIAPVSTEAEAVAFISEMRKQHHDAAHNVYAYVLRDGQLKRYSDDGEPQGTGGVPVLSVLERSGLVDVCVVVTRYFGGILLGAGGLVRAYSKGASAAVEAAQVMHMTVCKTVVLELDYAYYDKLNYLLPKFHIVVKEVEYGEKIRAVYQMKEQFLEGFCRELQELTGGKTQAVVIGEEYADLP